MDKKVTIFSTPACPYCRRTKQLLSKRGIEFDEYDVTSDKAAMERMKEISGGARSVPVIKVCDTVMIGLDEAELEKALECLES